MWSKGVDLLFHTESENNLSMLSLLGLLAKIKV